MKLSRKLYGVLGLLAACAITGALAAAEPATGKLTGKVKESSGSPLAGASITVGTTGLKATSGTDGSYTIDKVPAGSHEVACSRSGYKTEKKKVTIAAGATLTLEFSLSAAAPAKPEAEKKDAAPMADEAMAPPPAPAMTRAAPAAPMRSMMAAQAAPAPMGGAAAKPSAAPAAKAKMVMKEERPAEPMERDADTSGESYQEVKDNPFLGAAQTPFSTFSIDVDTASYANTRRFLTGNSIPPKDAVRIEELVNYFPYEYKAPTGPDPFAVTTEVAACPWNKNHRLALIGLQGRKVDSGQMPPANLVFLIDVSGSMSDPNKLPLLISAFKLLVGQMRAKDRVALTVYAGAAGVVLPSTPGNEKEKIIAALDKLQAGGSTAGAAGIQLAYQVAKDNFIQGGNNRVIIATDGDFNVGPSSDGELERMIVERRNQGIFLTVLGFGMGNYKDSKMETLADKGNGNYAYIDNFNEARKVLVNQMSGTLLTIAKDVKIQIEFNPQKIKAYRLIGYENRMLAKEDFENDKKDAGELGAGHTVTAFYELVLASSDEKIPGLDGKPQGNGQAQGQVAPGQEQKSQAQKEPLQVAAKDLLLVKLRYKKPTASTSTLLTQPLADLETPLEKTSETYRFASAVAEFGLLLRNSEWKASANYAALIKRASGAVGKDEFGYRKEFLTLAEKAATLQGSR